MKKALIVLFFFLFAVFNAAAAPGPSKSSQLVAQALDHIWKILMDETIHLQLKYGIKIKRLPSVSFEKFRSDIIRVRAIQKLLKQVKPHELSYDEQLSLKIMQWDLNSWEKELGFFWLNVPISLYRSPIPPVNQVFPAFQFQDKNDTQRYLHLLRQYPTFIWQVIETVTEQQRKKIIPPLPVIKQAIGYLDSLAQEGEKSLFYVQADRLQKVMQTPEDIAAFQKEVNQVISTGINPMLKKLSTFIAGDYLKNAPQQVGLWQYPGGKEYYKLLVKYYTGLDLTPEQVHETGLAQIKILDRKLDELRKEVQFKGDLEAFRHFIRTDPRFRLPTADAMGERLRGFKKQAEAQLPRFFSHIPAAPCDVKRLDPLLEASMTYGYFQTPTAADPVGYYLYNASNLENKSILNTASASLILHELLPGHHFEIALHSENRNLHNVRREYRQTAYVEGWAEYAAELGHEMGIYKDPYERCGRIMQDLFMSVRLVVDTGMNYFQWPREKAARLMKKHLLLSDGEIESETLRYSSGIPGQALAYKIGSLKILELREHAQKALGAAFDIKKFHDALLGSGTMPLFLLEEHVNHKLKTDKED